VKRLALLVAAAAALAVPAAQAGAPPIAAQTSFSPLVHLFGDTVTARLDVSVDPKRVDPSSVRVAAAFAPYTAGHGSVARLAGSENVVLIRFSYPLRCFTAACTPRAKERTFTLRPATVHWRVRGGVEQSAPVEWPPLTVASRLSPRDLALPELLAGVAPPAPSYSLPPGLLGTVLMAGGGAAAVGGAAGLVLLLRPRRRPQASPALAEALDLVERAAAGEVVERRRALYALALALEEARLEPEATAARKIAWASAPPDPDGMKQLALVVRGQIEEAA
jgi:hypothetical protein